MRIYLTAVITAIGVYAAIAEGAGYSVGLGIEYNPIARLDYINESQIDLDVVDNVALEPGIYYSLSNGFRAGVIYSIYSKKVTRGATRIADLSSWGIGLVGDYGYEITESGMTLLVGGMEAGYGELTDKNEFSERTMGGVWIAGLGGIRHHFTQAISFEMDFRVKWLQYDFSEIPKKRYDFSGSTIRITLGYGIYSSRN